MKTLPAFFAFLLAATPAMAAQIKVEIRDRPPELIVTNGEPSGPIFDLVEAIMAEAGHTPEYVEVPWKRSISLAEKGETGMLVRHSMDDERATFLHPMPYGYEEREVLFIRKKGGDADPTSFDELKNYVIGQRAQAFYYPEFNQSTDLQRDEAKDEETLIKKLDAGRIDLIISDDLDLFKENAKAAGLPYEENFEPATHKEILLNGRFFSVPQTGEHAQFYKDLNCAIYKLRVSGKVDEIYNAAGVTPPIQSFDEPYSKAQKEACEG